MKITLLQIENLKRLKAVRLEPSSSGLTVIGGGNAQGKTSVLDGIAYALGGEAYRPSSLRRDGALADAAVHIETDDGLVIERKGRNAALTVTDATGARRGQTLLNALVSRLAIDLPRFLNASDREKADTLLQILGIGDALTRLDRDIKAKYDTRTQVGRMADQKRKAADDMPWHDGLPDAPVSVADLLKSQQDILARNGVKRRLAEDLAANKRQVAAYRRQLEEISRTVERLEKAVADAEREDLSLEDTSALEARIADHEATNRRIAENAAKRAREAEAADLRAEYDALTEEIEALRKARLDLLKNADLPFPGLGVDDSGALTLDGRAWDCMSGAQQMVVGAAIASRLNPQCRFVLLDKLEQLDLDTLREFDAWLVANDLQAIATRVSTNADGECSLVIEDGEVRGGAAPAIPFAAKPRRAEALSDSDY